MVPIRLSLRNFMCYREPVTLDLEGHSLICLSGDNGHGKSALLDAVTWALWGEARGKRNEELVHQGQGEMEVDLDFLARGEGYRVVRRLIRRQRQWASQLELQAASERGYRPITGDSVAQTEEKLRHILGLDYQTFINSAYLLQGRADEFTTKRPAERKEVLGKILDLSLYDLLEEKARKEARERELQERKLAYSLEELEARLSKKEEYQREEAEARGELDRLEEELRDAESIVASLEREKQALELKRAQRAELSRRLREEEEALASLRGHLQAEVVRLNAYKQTLARAEEIEAGYAHYLKAREDYDEQSRLSESYIDLYRKREGLQARVAVEKGALEAAVKELKARCTELEAKASSIPRWQKEKERAQALLEQLAQEEEGLKEERKGLQEGALEAQRARDRVEGLGREVAELREKLGLLEGEGARCPLCQTELGEEGRSRLFKDFQRQVANREEEIGRLRQESVDRMRRLSSLEGEIARKSFLKEGRKGESQRSLAVAEREMKEGEGAAGDLVAQRANLNEKERLLLQGGYAQADISALAEISQKLLSLGYDPERRRAAEAELRRWQGYDKEHRALEDAQRDLPQSEARVKELEKLIAPRETSLVEGSKTVASLDKDLEALPGTEERLRHARSNLERLRQLYSQASRRLGAARQKLEECLALEEEKSGKEKALRSVREEMAIYQELASALGKKGVQALIIDSVLEEIEEEANSILARLTEGRMTLRLESLAETKEGKPQETLEIKISDEWGERSYEMYSGGEAFRINFALRIALSKLLARRAGASIPTLIIDEGFGTQDASGREHLMEAINAIRGEFEKIIVITHLEEIKDLFPVRFLVSKTPQGSTISMI